MGNNIYTYNKIERGKYLSIFHFVFFLVFFSFLVFLLLFVLLASFRFVRLLSFSISYLLLRLRKLRKKRELLF